MPQLQSTLTEAINAVTAQGGIANEQLLYWERRIRQAAEADMPSDEAVKDQLDRTLRAIYRQQVENGGILAGHPGVSRFKLDQVRPALRRELDRRIMASAQLIRLNRSRAVDQTLQRFAGWSTSITPGGAVNVDRVEEKQRIRKSVAGNSFEVRRVLIDQGHKLSCNLSDILARDAGAIAVEWHSNYRQPGYNYRPDHKERDGRVYLLRRSWARERGFVKPGNAGCYEDITAFAEEPFCRCRGRWIYSLRALERVAPDMLTREGLAARLLAQGQ